MKENKLLNILHYITKTTKIRTLKSNINSSFLLAVVSIKEKKKKKIRNRNAGRFHGRAAVCHATELQLCHAATGAPLYTSDGATARHELSTQLCRYLYTANSELRRGSGTVYILYVFYLLILYRKYENLINCVFGIVGGVTRIINVLLVFNLKMIKVQFVSFEN